MFPKRDRIHGSASVLFDGIKDDRGKTLTGAEITIVLFPIFYGASKEFGRSMEFLQSAAVALGGVPPRVGG